MSILGALTARKNVAALLDSPSCTMPALSDNWRVWPVAGLKREHVRLSSCNDDAALRSAYFPARAAVSPTTSATAIGALDAAFCVSSFSASRKFVPETTRLPPTVQLPSTDRADTVAQAEASKDRTVVC